LLGTLDDPQQPAPGPFQRFKEINDARRIQEDGWADSQQQCYVAGFHGYPEIVGAARSEDLLVRTGEGAPDSVLTQSQVNEPTVGVNGYIRKQVTQDATGWPVTGNVGVENYVESLAMVWVPTGPFDKAITRLALFDTATQDPTNPIYALSVALPAELVMAFPLRLKNAPGNIGSTSNGHAAIHLCGYGRVQPES
jgi:hypothetical protein